MRIVRIAVRNFLGIRDFETELKDGMNVVSGSNGSGKSSFLKAVQKALRGGRADGPWVIHRLRNGSGFIGAAVKDDDHDEPTVAEILVELDGAISINRRITAKGTDVKVTRREGALNVNVPAPQSFLDSIVSPNSLNPVEFFNAPAAERRKILLSLVPPLLTRNDVAGILQEHFEPNGISDAEIPLILAPFEKIGLEELRRLDDVIMLRRQAAWGVKEHHEEASKAEEAKIPAGVVIDPTKTDMSNLLAELEAANKTQSAVTAARHSLTGIVAERDRAGQDIARVVDDGAKSVQRIKNQVALYRAEIAEIQEKLERTIRLVASEEQAVEQAAQNARAELVALEARVATAQEHLNTAVEAAVDPEPIRSQLSTYEQNKAYDTAFNLARQHEELWAAAAAAVRGYDAANQDGIRTQAPRLLWSRLEETPLKGLDLGMEGDRITVRGIDIDNLSTSEQIRVALAIAHAMAGELTTICVDGFEALDPSTRAAFRDVAKDAKNAKGEKFQYVIAEVADGPLCVNGGAA